MFIAAVVQASEEAKERRSVKARGAFRARATFSNTHGCSQRCMDEVFSDCTKIIISHQLQNIERCDKVIVLGEGRVLEAEAPGKNALFKKLLREGGNLDN